MRKYIFISILLLTSYINANSIFIEFSSDKKVWKKEPSVSITKNEPIYLRASGVKGKTIKWYRIIPNTSKTYKNANHPWEKNPYKWVGFADIKYTKIIMSPCS